MPLRLTNPRRTDTDFSNTILNKSNTVPIAYVLYVLSVILVICEYRYYFLICYGIARRGKYQSWWQNNAPLSNSLKLKGKV